MRGALEAKGVAAARTEAGAPLGHIVGFHTDRALEKRRPPPLLRGRRLAFAQLLLLKTTLGLGLCPPLYFALSRGGFDFSLPLRRGCPSLRLAGFGGGRFVATALRCLCPLPVTLRSAE